MRPSASGFGFGGAAGCAGRVDGCAGKAAQSVRSKSDRSFGFWPRTTCRGSACAAESAQAVAVTVRPRWFEPRGTADCAGGAAQAVVFSRRSASDLFFGSLSSSGSSSGSSSSSGSFSKSETLTACAGEAAQAVVSLRDGDFEEVRRAVTRSSSTFSLSSSDSSSGSMSMTSELTFEVRVGDCGGWASLEVENWTWVGISVQRPWLSMQL